MLVNMNRRDHYSYTVYADPVTAASFDERRFGGPIGQLIAVEQARVLAEFAGPIEGRSILDVGTGTGRAAIGRCGAARVGRSDVWLGASGPAATD